jgi:hypothetical protein
MFGYPYDFYAEEKNLFYKVCHHMAALIFSKMVSKYETLSSLRRKKCFTDSMSYDNDKNIC